MKVDSKPLRYAHTEGHTHICYSEDGRYIITSGHDGDVRIWLDIEDDEPTDHCIGASVSAICFKEKRLYVSTDNHAVQAYTFPAFDKDGIITRFTAPVTQIMSSPKIDIIGCTSENMEAKICSLEGGDPLFVMSEHKGPVLSIAICPQMKFAATASGDGTLRVWDIDTQKIVKELPCVPKINTFYAAKVICRMSFEPTEGKYLAYPNNKEIILLDSSGWGQRLVFTHSTIKCAISQCLFSPCGQYLAGSSVAGQIAIWEVLSGNCIDVIDHPNSHNVSSMAWNPKGNGVLVYGDVIGQIGMLMNCYGKASVENGTDEMETVDEVYGGDALDDEMRNYAASDDDGAISLERIKNETLGLAKPESRSVSRASTVAPASKPAQTPFQPGSTPAHLEHSYMCWNEVGIVRCHNGENGESSIDVEFHDSNLHHGIHLNNYLGHTMASLSTRVLALACEAPSKLVCVSLVGSSKEWTVSLPDTEEVLCVTAAAGVVACATSARLLRIFTPMGTQRQVICLPGPVVCLGGFDTTVFAVYHHAQPGSSDQHLAMDIIAFNGRQVRSKTVFVPLTPGSRLTWLGSSEVGSPCCCDSQGVLRLYDVASGIWMPVCETAAHSKGVCDSWFTVSVNEEAQKVRAIMCRGASFPLTAPKPIVTELPIQLPLCELDTEKGQYEEQLVRWAHTTCDVDVKAARETALKLFSLACRSEIEQRGLELMELLKDERVLPLAAKYASRLGRTHLADKLTNLADAWQRNTDRLNTHFRELDAQETSDVTTGDDASASPIAPRRAVRTPDVAPIKPVPIKASPGGARNPFKKLQDSSKSVPSTLTLTERTLVDVHAAEHENDAPFGYVSGETFLSWFTRNKSTLEQQNPELTPSELTRLSIRTFKSGQSKSTGNSLKRKLDESIEESPTNAPKQSKLSAFAFLKKAQ